MAKGKPDLLADVQARIVVRRAGYASWFDKLPADAQAECLAVREAFRRGDIGTKSHVARALIAAAKERGWSISAEKQVGQWLARTED
jgi:GNAT superfamily N-acetyltransferase